MGMFLAALYEIVKYRHIPFYRKKNEVDVALYYTVLSEESYIKLCKI